MADCNYCDWEGTKQDAELDDFDNYVCPNCGKNSGPLLTPGATPDTNDRSHKE